MQFKDADIGERLFLVKHKLAVEKTHRIKAVTVDHPDSQLDAGAEHTVGPQVECERIDN